MDKNYGKDSICVNLGCGPMFCRNWVNLDTTPLDRCVARHDVSKKLPFDEGSVRFIYMSQVLEHLPRAKAEDLLRDCHRILSDSGGSLRVCVPDGEAIAREYLSQLEAVKRNPDETSRGRYDWICIEMWDQMVREKPTGEVVTFIESVDAASELGQYVRARASRLAEHIWERQKRRIHDGFCVPRKVADRMGVSGVRKWLLRRIFGEEYATLTAGRFAISGELHRWAYDYYSLSRALQQSGFSAIERKAPGQTDLIPEETRFGADGLDLKTVELHAAHLVVECHKA